MADDPERRPERRGRSTTATAGDSPVRGPTDAARRASQRLERLTGHPVDGVTAIYREEHGWRLDVDVLEVARIPDTTSLLATYQVELDKNGKLLQYHRVNRFRRCATAD
jgi:hypothetical protein